MNRKMMNTGMIIAMLGVLIISGCAGAPVADEMDSVQEEASTLQVVATIGMITDIARVIGGDHVNVQGLMGPGVDPHLYQASEGDVAKLSNADVVFYNGLHLEAKMGEVLEQMGDVKTVAAVAESIPEEELLGSQDYPGLHDPHVWFDVEKWMSAVEVVRDTLISVDSEHAASYEANAQEYLNELAELEVYVSEKASLVSEEQRVLVTAHDAFSYFGEKYKFEVMGLQGISTDAEAGTKDVQDLAQFIVDRKIKAIFVESSVPERNIRAVQEAVRAQGWDVVVGGELFSDAMGDEGTVEGTYVGMIRHNIDTIVEALV